MTDTIISLTTTPPRFDKIAPTLEMLLAQTADIAEIRITIPKSYRRFALSEFSLPRVPKGINLVRCDEDFGPATKVLPTVIDHKGDDVEIIFCDDDQIYEPEWAQRFIDARERRPDDCLAQNGYHLDSRPIGLRYFPTRGDEILAKHQVRNLKYRLRRVAGLFIGRPPRFASEGHIDILEGFRGAMVRPDFFPDEVFDIPDIIWTVDDPWLSGHLTRNGVGIWLVACPHPPEPFKAAHFADPLFLFSSEGYGRAEADTLCIEYFRQKYGIWSGPAEPISATLEELEPTQP